MNDKIKEIIKEALSGYKIEKIILFGSRARGDFNEDSDYDILIILDEELNRGKINELTIAVRKKIVELLIPADILIRSNHYVEYMKNKIGNVIKYATEEGVEI